MAKPVRLVKTPHKMAPLETAMRYDVLLNGQFFDELYFNMRGYVGTIPVLNEEGSIVHMNIGEVSLSAYRKEIAQTNREILDYEGQ